jgi:ABC-type glucose/galactose transport system permease subunit
MKQILATIVVVILIYTLSGCYYDREDVLYPGGASCDTSNVTYSGTVAPLINQYCSGTSCHGGAGSASGIQLDSYAGIKTKITDGRLWGAINWQAGFSPMPKNSTSKIPECAIKKIGVWISHGAPQN